MKIYLIIMMWFLCPKKLTGIYNHNEKLDQYLNRRGILLHGKINEKLRTIREPKEQSTVERTTLGSYTPHKDLNTNINIFSFFNKTFIAVNDELFVTSLGPSLDMDLYGNFTGNRYVTFFKSFEFRNMGFIATGTADETLIYILTKNSTSPELMQTILTPVNSDAIFFVNRGHLYLASTTNHGKRMGLITFYQWLDSYFDEIDSIATTGPSFIGSFAFKKSEIIIVGQYLPENPKIYSAIFEFKTNSVKKIQYINTNQPTRMDIFFQNGYPYILIYEESKRQLYFKWNGFEMVLLKMFHWEHNVNKSMVVYSKVTPLIVQPQLDKMLVYKAHKEDIGLERTKGYLTNYSVILAINKGENENGNITFIAGLNEDNIINIYAMSFKVQAEMEKRQDEGLPKCFNNLERKVYDRRKKLNQMKNALSQVQNAEKDTSDSRKRQTTSDTTDVTNIENKLEDIKTRLDKVKPFIMNPDDSIENLTVVNGKAIIKGNLVTKNATANNLNIKDINGKQWLPEQWLRYNKTQTITGPSRINQLTTKILVLKDDNIFKNLLMNQGTQKLNGYIKIKNITAKQIFTSKINDIKVKNIYIKRYPVIIKGLKIFDNVFANKAHVSYINDERADNVLSNLKNNGSKPQRRFAPDVYIENLEVDSIDNINWAKFEDSLFKIGQDDTIKGNLITSEIVTKQLTVQYLNGINTNHLMTKSTDQVINSTIEFNNIEASDIDCGTINDIDITKSAAVDQNGTIIKGPVRIAEVYVKNDLELVGKISQSFFVNGSDRIWGTNDSDLMQRYVGDVLIKGNLYVKDLSILPNTTIIVNGGQYTLNVFKEYWTKNSDQNIPVHFEAINGISTPHLKTRFLNTIPIENFALNDKTSKLTGPIFFENVTVDGSVFLNKSDHNNSLDIKKLATEGVRKHGGTYQIKGKKVFKNTLKVKHLQTSELNGKKTAETLVTQETKVYKRLTVKGDLISNIYAETINNIEISKYKENILALDSPQNLTDIAFHNVTVENLHVGTINGHSVKEYIENLKKILDEKQIKTINMKGNVTIQTVLKVKTINNHNMTDFLEKDLIQGESEADLTGDVKFTGQVQVAHLKTRNINGINFPELTERLLHKKSNQTVSGIFTFKNLKTEHLYTDQINDKIVENLIDVSLTDSQQLIAPKGIVFRKIKFEKSLSATTMLPCDLNKAMANMKYPESREWSSVEINGNVKLVDENCVLNRILEKSVKKDEENVIIAPVTINGHVLANRVRLFQKLNDINLTELIKDAVLSDLEEEQVITGHKIFPNVNAKTVTVLENTDIPIVNNIYIPELYKRIIGQEEVTNITILGKKTFFGGLQTNQFFSDRVSGVKLENIVNLANLSQIPNALFDSLEITNDLNIKFINSYDVDYILNNRLLTNTSQKQITNAIYFFRELEVKDNLRTPSINNVELKNVVFDLEKQKITAPKQFLQNITVFGNVSIGYLNGINISEAYDNALVRGRDEVINGSITILKPVRLEGNITADRINGYPIAKIQEILETPSNKTEEAVIFNTTEKIKNIILETLPAVHHMPNEFMYIERSEDLQIKIRNAVDARVTVIKDYALIHILSEESHIKCNLPEGCKCPVQHTVEITPHLSVSYFLNKGQQRIYSYDDDTMTIHLITNSISTDTNCRTNQSKVFNEMSTMSWSSATTGNITGSFNVYPSYFLGYISGAEFFTLDDATFAIISRYYDPVADTHDLDCIVLKFSRDKTTAMEIQRIPTKGVWTLYLLHTAQGVTLVIGNLAKQPYTEIYRFHEDSQKFKLLRTVAYGCTKAVGVVLGTDSLIILANKNAPLQVLKYNSYFDNFYYYQMFSLDEPVVGISVFYVGGFGISDAYLCIVTEENYRIYSFQYIDGWKLESTGTIRGLRNLIPVELNNQLYLFAPSNDESSLLTVVKHGAGGT